MGAADLDREDDITIGKKGTLSDARVFDGFACERCSHPSQRHAGYTGPCADCWAIMAIDICEHFIMREEDRAAVEAIQI